MPQLENLEADRKQRCLCEYEFNESILCRKVQVNGRRFLYFFGVMPACFLNTLTKWA
jgi:hypothetical protein